MQEVKLNISGMVCMGCVNTLSKVLQSTQGVQSAVVDKDSASASIHFNPQEVTIQSLIDAISDAGYDAHQA